MEEDEEEGGAAEEASARFRLRVSIQIQSLTARRSGNVVRSDGFDHFQIDFHNSTTRNPRKKKVVEILKTLKIESFPFLLLLFLIESEKETRKRQEEESFLGFMKGIGGRKRGGRMDCFFAGVVGVENKT